MKHFLWVIGVALLFSCNVGSGLSTEVHNLHIMLNHQIKPEAIVKDYESRGLTYLKESSRTEPLYFSQVSLSKGKFNSLFIRLKQDDRIVSVVELDQLPEPGTNSTNSGFGKTKPINK